MSTPDDVLLDTSVVIAHFRSRQGLTAQLGGAARLCMPWVVLGELHFGAQRAQRHEEALAQIHDFLKIAELLLPDQETSERNGRVKAELAQAGRPIPENDVWIAALALQYQLPLATKDEHFAVVPHLRILHW